MNGRLLDRLANVGESHGAQRVEHITVIRVVATRGLGENDSPIRQVTSYWLPDGTCIAEDDPCPSPRRA